VLRQSILQQKVRDAGFTSIQAAPHSSLLTMCQSTLKELEKYLDTGDLRQLTYSSLGIMKQDLLDIISSLREVPLTEQKEKIRTMDGILNNLRLARDNLQTAHGMFKGELLDESKSKKFFAEHRSARENIEKALKNFK